LRQQKNHEDVQSPGHAAVVRRLPATVLAQQVYYPAERITIYEYQAHADFVARERGGIQSGGANARHRNSRLASRWRLATLRGLPDAGATVFRRERPA
jgi:hypothetical protein